METARRSIIGHKDTFLILAAILFCMIVLGQRTTDRYTGADAAEDWSEQHEVDARQDHDIFGIKSFLGME